MATLIAAIMAISVLSFAPSAGAAPAAAPNIDAACENAESAGFTDIAGAGDSFVTAINCLAAFGVTAGTTATTYSPAQQVSRAQMALFYYRMGSHFDAVEWDTSDAGFTDLGGLSDESTDAINALANAGVVLGTTETTFSPTNSIVRSQMALFIDRFQELVTGFRYSDGVTGDDAFPDIAELGDEARAAVNGIAAAGITQGNTDGTYGPNTTVSRQQMAMFIVRHLVDNGLEVPGEGVTGLVVALAPDDYRLSTGTAAYDVKIAAGDTFTVDGVPATKTVFDNALGVGDRVTWNEENGTHDLVNGSPYTAGFAVGEALNLGNSTTDLIDVFTGEVVLNSVTLDSTGVAVGQQAVYRIGNATVSAENFFGAISVGDTLTVENHPALGAGYDDDANTVFRLQNNSLTSVYIPSSLGGPALQMNPLSADWAHPLGNNLAGGDTFVLVDTSPTKPTGAQVVIRADGAPVNVAELTNWLLAVAADDELPILTYSRNGNVETFTFISIDTPDAEPGSITGEYVGGTFVAGSPSTIQILVGVDTYTVQLPAIISIDGVNSAPSDIPDDVDAGASVTVTLPNGSLLEDLPSGAVINATVTGAEVTIQN